jgi:hypothetical protein
MRLAPVRALVTSTTDLHLWLLSLCYIAVTGDPGKSYHIGVSKVCEVSIVHSGVAPTNYTQGIIGTHSEECQWFVTSHMGAERGPMIPMIQRIEQIHAIQRPPKTDYQEKKIIALRPRS